MPKQTPSIPNEVLWANLGDRSALSDELLLVASQVGTLLNRSPDQLVEDRKVGNPPPFKKIGGSVFYRLGTVRDLIFNSPEFNNTTQARQAANKNRLGIHSNFLVWQAYAEDDDLWPFLIRDGERPIEFWESLTLGDQLSGEERCEFLRHDCFLSLRASWCHRPPQEQVTEDDVEASEDDLEPRRDCESKEVLGHSAFIEFLDGLEELSEEKPTPLRIASAPFDKIYAPEHLLWIHQTLNGTRGHRAPQTQKMYALLHEAYKCKQSYWTIRDAILILLNESTVIYTPSRELKSAEIAELIYQAECAARDKVLPSSLDFGGNIVVKPIEILEWAKEYGIEVHPDIERAITGRVIGALSVQTLGRPTDPTLEQRGKDWRKATYDLMKEMGKITYVSAARWIYENKEKNIADAYAVETIRRELTNKKMAADKWDMTKIKKNKESREFSYEHGKGW